MDKKELIQYRDLIKEIKRLEKRKKKLKDEEQIISHDKVSGSNLEFPYQPINLTIEGYTNNKYKIDKLNSILERRKNHCENLKIEIEEFISNIPDSRTRQIFEMRYVEGQNWDRISEFMGSRDDSYARKIHDRFLCK